MNAASVIVLVVVIALAVLAVWRNVRKGAPCECGGSCASLRSCLKRRNGCHSCNGHCGGNECHGRDSQDSETQVA
jgi:hypothetical protein